MRSMKGIRMANPGSRIRLNLPMRSTIHAVCCGTNRTTVLAGSRGFWKYDGRELPPVKLAGSRLRADVVMKRDCCNGARRLALTRADDMVAICSMNKCP